MFCGCSGNIAGSSAKMCASDKRHAWPENGDVHIGELPHYHGSCSAQLGQLCMCLLLAANVRLGFRKEEYLIISTEFLDTKIFDDVALSRLPTLMAAVCVLCNLVKTRVEMLVYHCSWRARFLGTE